MVDRRMNMDKIGRMMMIGWRMMIVEFMWCERIRIREKLIEIEDKWIGLKWLEEVDWIWSDWIDRMDRNQLIEWMWDRMDWDQWQGKVKAW